MHIFKKFIQHLSRHKLASGVGVSLLVLAAIFGPGFFSSDAVAPRYVLARVTKGPLAQSVSGTGQVSAGSQVVVKSKVGGEVLRLPYAETAVVSAGAPIAYIDATDAKRAIRDAEIALETSQLDLLKIKQSQASLGRILEDAFSKTANAFLDTPKVMSDLQDIILGTTLSGGGQDNRGYFNDFISNNDDGAKHDRMVLFTSLAEADYRSARTAYDNALLLYKSATRFSDEKTLTALLREALEASKKISQSLKSHQNLLDYLVEYAKSSSRSYSATIATHQATLKTDIALINGHVSTLASAVDDVANAPFTIRSQEIVIKQRETDLADAQDALSDYTVRVPFSGALAELSVRAGDTVSAGTAIATLVSNAYSAEISLNEVDIAMIHVGQKATLSFDALPGLTLSGTVSQIDTLGTTSQGVVTYTVLVQLDTADARIKPGMSVSASIVVAEKQDVLRVPVAAVKTIGDRSAVEIVPGLESDVNEGAFRQGITSELAPQRVSIKTGLANDTFVEVVEGLSEGDLIIGRTITTGATTATQSPAGGFGGLRIPGVTGATRAR